MRDWIKGAAGAVLAAIVSVAVGALWDPLIGTLILLAATATWLTAHFWPQGESAPPASSTDHDSQFVQAGRDAYVAGRDLNLVQQNRPHEQVMVDQLADLAVEAQALHAWSADASRDEEGLEEAVNDWHGRVEPFLDTNFGKQYFVRLHNHRDYTFYSGGSRISWSQYRINARHHLDGDSRRMNEFLAEVSR